jgi:outer membrane protein assembly factor BamB
MKRSFVALLILFLAVPLQAENWPGWRGPRGDGTVAETNVPVYWDNTHNVEWKVPIPGVGHSSPIVWEKRIFLVTCLEKGSSHQLLCLDGDSGKTLWQKEVLKTTLHRIHRLNTHASSTPLTDGERVYVSFLDDDKMFIAAYDFDGKKLWEKRPGGFSSVHGYCASPILWKDTIIVNGDHDGDAYIVALDRKSGKTKWKIDRPSKTRSYVTPIIRHIDGRDQMILSGSKSVTSYDPNNGKQHWIIDGPTEQFVASMVYNGELLFMTCGFPTRHMMAIKPDGKGNVTKTHVAWHERKGASYVPSPVAVGDYFVVVSDSGMASCFEAKTGKRLWMQRLNQAHSASMITANGLAYFLSDDGVMTIVRPGPKFDVVNRSDLGEPTRASPVVSDGKLYLRGTRHLYRIGGDGKPPPPGNIAGSAKLTASTVQVKWDGEGPVESVVDGDLKTRWSTQFADDSVKDRDVAKDNKQHLLLDFGKPTTMTKVVLHWETAAAKRLDLLVSDDGKAWKKVAEKKDGAAGPRSDTFELKGAKGRHLKLELHERATKYGYSLYEIEVY